MRPNHFCNSRYVGGGQLPLQCDVALEGVASTSSQRAHIRGAGEHPGGRGHDPLLRRTHHRGVTTSWGFAHVYVRRMQQKYFRCTNENCKGVLLTSQTSFLSAVHIPRGAPLSRPGAPAPRKSAPKKKETYSEPSLGYTSQSE